MKSLSHIPRSCICFRFLQIAICHNSRSRVIGALMSQRSFWWTVPLCVYIPIAKEESPKSPKYRQTRYVSDQSPAFESLRIHLHNTSCYIQTPFSSLQWIQLFNKLTKDSPKGTHSMLICDQFGSHLTYDFVKYCEDHKIIPFFLPPHSSHLLQPLDVGVFSAYKHWHSEWVYDATVSGYERITWAIPYCDRADLAEDLQTFYN